MKVCSICGGDPQPDSAFNKNKKRKDGLQNKCRVCSRQLSKGHYEDNKTYYQDKRRRYKKEVSEAIRQLKARPCMDCGNSFPPCAMDFDHRDGKDKTGCIRSLINQGWSLDKVLEEVRKCDLICANCHRIRTHARSSGVPKKSLKRFR